MVALNGRLYVVGGVGPRAEEVWRLDPRAGRWEVVTRLPTPREHLAAVAHEGRLVVIAGRWRGEGNLSTVERFDPAGGRWETLPPLPTPRGGLTAGAIGRFVHVTGGEAFSPAQTFDQHEVLDMRERGWHSEPPLPVARHGLASVVMGGRWYVIGGGTEAGMRTLLTASCRVDMYLPPPGGD
jgi:N-acetylneuraminic acid mutarotase